MSLSPINTARAIGSGLLAFPVTHFDADLRFEEKRYRAHCANLAEYDVAGLFAAGGTGEFFSLTLDEVERVVRAAVTEIAGLTAYFYSPPYLVGAEQDGLAAHVEAVAPATGLGVIVYNRDNAVLEAETLARLCERNPNIVGFKDGVGDLELMTRVHRRMGDRLTSIGGLPTAETFALPYFAMGVTSYSSAIFNFMPDWAMGFYQAVRAGNSNIVDQALVDFVLPYIAIRDRGRGYAVSIVKTGMRVIGCDAGEVRSPLTMLDPDEMTALGDLIARNRDAFAT